MKRTKLKIWLNNTWEDLFPETSAELIHTNKGATLDVWLQDFDNIVGGLTSHINRVEETANEALSLALGASVAKVFDTYPEMIVALNSATSEDFKVGQNFLIRMLNVPDVWISAKSDIYIPFEYTTDEEFIAQLQNAVQVGWYTLSPLETQKVDLTDYVKVTDYATADKAGAVKVNNNNSGMRVSSGQLQLYPASPVAISLRNQTDVVYGNSAPITTGNLNIAVIAALTDNKKILMTDEEKTSACNSLGALKKETAVTNNHQAYVKAASGVNMMWNMDNGPTASAICVRDGNGRLRITDPLNAEDAATKGYVDSALAGIGGGSTKLYRHIFTYPQYGSESVYFFSIDAEKYSGLSDLLNANYFGRILRVATAPVLINGVAITITSGTNDDFKIVVCNNSGQIETSTLGFEYPADENYTVEEV